MAADGSAFKQAFLSTWHRTKQYAEEKAGVSERTGFDPSFEHLVQRVEATRSASELVLSKTETFLEPNPNRRLEASVLTLVGRKPQERMTEMELMGAAMCSAAESLPESSSYGVALLKTGKVYAELGQQWCHFQSKCLESFVRPVRQFLGSDVKSAMAEKKKLASTRLDFDAARSKVRKASTGEKQMAAEAELQRAQSAFDRQLEVTQLLLESCVRSCEEHVHRLCALVDAQHAYFAAGAEITANLGRELRRNAGLEPPSYVQAMSSGGSEGGNSNSSGGGTNRTNSNDDGAVRDVAEEAPRTSVVPPAASASSSLPVTAQVLRSFEGSEPGHMRLTRGEVVLVRRTPDDPPGWVYVERNGVVGKVPESHLDL